MISKKFRLTEREVKKVLKWWKPFFSYWIVSNSISNKLEYNRFAIVISWKSVKSSVERNFFRRRFFDETKNYIFSCLKGGYDFVFIVKKENKLDKKDKKNINTYGRDIEFLFSKILPK